MNSCDIYKVMATLVKSLDAIASNRKKAKERVDFLVKNTLNDNKKLEECCAAFDACAQQCYEESRALAMLQDTLQNLKDRVVRGPDI